MSDDSASTDDKAGASEPLSKEDLEALGRALNDGRMGFDPYTIDLGQATPLNVFLAEAEDASAEEEKEES